MQLREDEYESFVSSHALGNFSQSLAAAKHRKLTGWQTYLVGVRNKKGAVVAAAMLTSRSSFRRLAEFEAVQGPVTDYDNEAVVKFFFAELRRFLRRQNAIRLRVSPPVALNHRDKESNIISDGYDGDKYIQVMKDQGFVHIDNETADADSQLSRWYASKDMTQYETADDLLKSFDLQTRWSIKKAAALGVMVKPLTIESIDEFYDVLEHQTSKKTTVHSKQYYQDLAEAYGDDIQFCVAQLDLTYYETIVTQQLVDATAIISDINPRTRSVNKKRQLAAAKKMASLCAAKLATVNIMRKDGDIATLAAAIFVRSGNELVYLGGRSYEKHLSFGASYALQWYGQLYAMENNISRINFAATKGTFSGNPEYQGAFRFKKGFGAVVEERIGYFEIYPYSHISNRLVLGRSTRTPQFTRSSYTLKNVERSTRGQSLTSAITS